MTSKMPVEKTTIKELFSTIVLAEAKTYQLSEPIENWKMVVICTRASDTGPSTYNPIVVFPYNSSGYIGFTTRTNYGTKSMYGYFAGSNMIVLGTSDGYPYIWKVLGIIRA